MIEAKERRFVESKDVDTLVFDWGRIQFLSEPGVTGAQRMTAGIVTLETGRGHERHNHPNEEEILFVLEGEGTQTVYADSEERRPVFPGTMIHLPAGVYHSTVNTGTEPMKILVVYSPTGPEAFLRSLPGCRIESPATADKDK
jgi:oxalate decarboxylase/phosphoglucose isomerase-like protein (cupin superfamily)